MVDGSNSDILLFTIRWQAINSYDPVSKLFARKGDFFFILEVLLSRRLLIFNRITYKFTFLDLELFYISIIWRP